MCDDCSNQRIARGETRRWCRDFIEDGAYVGHDDGHRSQPIDLKSIDDRLRDGNKITDENKFMAWREICDVLYGIGIVKGMGGDIRNGIGSDITKDLSSAETLLMGVLDSLNTP